MSGKRYTEEFKIETVKQVTECGYSASEVARRLGVNAHSLYAWIKKHGKGLPMRPQLTNDRLKSTAFARNSSASPKNETS
jgi:transposase-like protein